ncbi:hypothetical protein [Staphylococcus saprophyticus]|uniref:hypothetical protein n=1 Tax=Staphylococcus saprophyticus TaxID=29385 RepID=UPI000853918D|nr:hypothetical protein [Staphylococcus saprophyticus]OEK41281.1 hypothetical protein ASS88_01325 [Staphylococcus saprophyticus]
MENNNEKFLDKVKEWVKAHKIWSGIIALVIVSCIVGPFMEEEETQSEEPEKETVANDSSKEKQEAEEEEKAKQEQADKDAKDKQEAKEKKETEEKAKKPLTDEQKLNKKLKKEVTSADVKGVEFGTGQSDVTIELKGKSNMSDKLTSRGFKMGTVEALYALKKSGIDVNSAEIYVYFPLNDGMKDEEKMVMSTRWDRATIDAMNEDAKFTLPDHIEEQAENTFMHPTMRKNQ